MARSMTVASPFMLTALALLAIACSSSSEPDEQSDEGALHGQDGAVETCGGPGFAPKQCSDPKMKCVAPPRPRSDRFNICVLPAEAGAPAAPAQPNNEGLDCGGFAGAAVCGDGYKCVSWKKVNGEYVPNPGGFAPPFRCHATSASPTPANPPSDASGQECGGDMGVGCPSGYHCVGGNHRDVMGECEAD